MPNLLEKFSKSNITDIYENPWASNLFDAQKLIWLNS